MCRSAICFDRSRVHSGSNGSGVPHPEEHRLGIVGRVTGVDVVLSERNEGMPHSDLNGFGLYFMLFTQ